MYFLKIYFIYNSTFYVVNTKIVQLYCLHVVFIVLEFLFNNKSLSVVYFS